MLRFTHHDITVLCGDCSVWLRGIAAGHTIITDPPFTMMNQEHLNSMLAAFPYQAADVLVLTNPLSGYLYGGEFKIVPELSTATTNYHRHQRPLDGMIELVRLTTGPVLDPYCGSGTTLLAAHALGRPSIGIEQDEETFKRCCERIEKYRGYGGPNL
jgi:DNA modification methylase